MDDSVSNALNNAISAITVSAFLKALNDHDYEAAREFLADDLSFEGVLGAVEGKSEYLKQMAKMKLRYDVKKLVYDEENVAVLYEIEMSGHTVLTSGWYEVTEGKISHIRVVFDPRPVLPQ